MKNICLSLFICCVLNNNNVYAQDETCKVLSADLKSFYKGECKNGLANGEGEAKGIINHYTGTFKNGKPNGKGTCYYGDSIFYSGNFQDGIKEGKGELHYLQTGQPDSVIKGYWSGDEFRGKKYTTYNLSGSIPFARMEINPSSQSGNSISFEISTTTGSPTGSFTGSGAGGSGYILTLVELTAYPENAVLPFFTRIEDARKSIYTFKLMNFPTTLRARFSTGDNFELELYKAADWKVRIALNQ